MSNLYLGHALNPELQAIYTQALTELQTFGRTHDLYYCRRIDRSVSGDEINKVATLEHILLTLENVFNRQSILELLTDSLPTYIVSIVDLEVNNRYVALVVASMADQAAQWRKNLVDLAILHAVEIQRRARRTPREVHSYHALLSLADSGEISEKRGWTQEMAEAFQKQWNELGATPEANVLKGDASNVYSADMEVHDVYDPACNHIALTHSGLLQIIDTTHVSVKFSDMKQRNDFVQDVIAVCNKNLTGPITSYTGWDMPQNG
jgi:hypothetical protein